MLASKGLDCRLPHGSSSNATIRVGGTERIDHVAVIVGTTWNSTGSAEQAFPRQVVFFYIS